jgi:hypothetical protein
MKHILVLLAFLFAPLYANAADIESCTTPHIFGAPANCGNVYQGSYTVTLCPSCTMPQKVTGTIYFFVDLKANMIYAEDVNASVSTPVQVTARIIGKKFSGSNVFGVNCGGGFPCLQVGWWNVISGTLTEDRITGTIQAFAGVGGDMHQEQYTVNFTATLSDGDSDD